MTSAGRVPRTRAEMAAFVIARFEAMGINLAPQSRIMRMHRILTECPRTIQPNEPEFEIALEAERDMQLLSFVFDQAVLQGGCSHFYSLVKRVVKDSILPQNDRDKSEGRNYQFELFVAAICQSAGLSPVDYEEPDVTCAVDGVKFGIAAKRLKNMSNLDKRVKKASEQIKKAGLPGIIALDTSLALNPENARFTTPISDEEFGRFYSQAFHRLLDEYYSKIIGWVVNKGVRGVIFHDHQVRLKPNGDWGLDSMTFRVSTWLIDDPPDFSCFERRYIAGLPNLKC